MSLNQTPAKSFKIRPEYWLIYSLYYFMPLFFIEYSTIQLVLFFTAYGIFIACYLSICRNLYRPTVHWLIAGVVLLATVTSFLTSSVDSFFSYAALFMGMVYPLRLFIPLMAAMLALILALGFWHDYSFPFLTVTGPFSSLAMSLIGLSVRLNMQSQRREQRSREEIQQLAMIAERERIARDLHDILGHSLSSIALKAELAEKLIGQNKAQESRTHLSDLNQIARESLQLVRQTVSGYKHRGLTGEVMELCERLRQNNFSVTLEGKVPALNSKAETTLILALTELITNVMRHSRGTECRLEFECDQERLNISVTDNGSNATIHLGNGLKGIQERIAAFNGNLKFDTGSRSRFTIDLPTAQAIAS